MFVVRLGGEVNIAAAQICCQLPELSCKSLMLLLKRSNILKEQENKENKVKNTSVRCPEGAKKG